MIEVYTNNGCVWCEQAKKLLTSKDLEYVEKRISTDESLKAELLSRKPDVRTVPQIFIDNNYIGGYTDLVKYFQNS